MIKQFTRFQVAALKRTMKNIAPLLRKRESLEKKADEILSALKNVDEQIAAYKQTIEPITEGIDPEIIISNNGIVEILEKPEIPEDNEVELASATEGSEVEMPGFELPITE